MTDTTAKSNFLSSNEDIRIVTEVFSKRAKKDWCLKFALTVSEETPKEDIEGWDTVDRLLWVVHNAYIHGCKEALEFARRSMQDE